MNRLTESLDFQGNALLLRAERQRVLASNIANADTPGYKARDMAFADVLRESTGAAGLGGSKWRGTPAAPLPAALADATSPSTLAWAGARRAAFQDAASGLALTHAAHVGAGGGAEQLMGRLVYARPSQDALDRNTVDLDRERASFADNTVRYEAALRFINGQVRTLQDAMRPPSQG